ncbi:CRISPR-associated helicase Cas3' [Serratia aquatilis]|uniref:CRISPR-associated helicase Cas3 n=1 Tax=Serratia aquatilis TaxID=1737515 RepID=A0ABV6E814_9GAMM
MMPNDSATYMRYWGKARKVESDSCDDYHLLAYHCLDVAACGYQLIIDNRYHSADILEELGFSRQDAATWFAYFLTMHDIGKFARGFQQLYQHPALVPPAGKIYIARHDSLGFWLWNEHIQRRWLEDDRPLFPGEENKKQWRNSLHIWLQIVTGHHGVPPDASAKGALAFTPEDLQAAEFYLQDVRKIFQWETFPQQFADKEWRKNLKKQSWILAGLSVLADWLGSNQAYFPFTTTVMPLTEYWENAQQRAQTAIAALPTSAVVSAFKGHKDLFPFIERLTPLQQLACDIKIEADGAQLMILEDVTGAGKTEAALILAHRLMAQSKADGLYIGLPTMATANAMYQRLADAYRALFQPQTRPSLVLAHGASKMSAAFSQSVWQLDNQGSAHYGQTESSASGECNIWFADSRKKALLAEVGVGTLDQLLMAVMPFRHQSLRLVGMLNKVLILDEVHAYDGYMVRLLEGLLYCHAAQGGSAIILSATLPHDLREKLLRAFASGAECEIPLLDPQAGYPWFSHLGRSGLHEMPVATREEVKRCVQVNWLTQLDEAIVMIEQAVKEQRCICWIRNSVDDAILVFRQLRERGNIPAENLLLFHSRFAFIDRMQIEQNALNWFGKHASPDSRRGKVLIATQVIEQSLDIDLDIMISDIAPIDLLIQRAGRLQRHIRDNSGQCKSALPDERPAPVLSILAPEWQPEATAGWLGETLRNTGYVYADHACLWRTQAILRELGAIIMPEQARTMVESVYAEMLDAPAELVEISNRVLGQLMSNRAAAGQNLLSLDKGYDRRASDTLWSDAVDISTRLSEPSLDVYLAYRKGSEIIPYANADDFPWEKSRLQVRESWWRKHGKALPQLAEDELERFKTQNHLFAGIVLLLDNAGEAGYYSKTQGLLG